MSISSQTDTADILDSTAVNGEIRCTLGDFVAGVGYSEDNPLWGQDGFVSRPNLPSSTGACQAWYVMDANDKRILSTYDPRFTPQVGDMDPGDRAIVTDGPPRILVKKESQSVVLYTENMDENSMMVNMNGLEGTIHLLAGTSWIKMSKGSIELGVSGGGQLIIDKSGVTVAGNSFVAACKSGTLGIIGSLLGGTLPAGPAMSIVAGPAGLAGTPSPGWTVSLTP